VSELPTLSFAEVCARGLTVVGDHVYDLTRFAARHPGGGEVAQLRRTDATFPLLNAHGIQGELVGRMPRNLRVGSIDPATLDPADRDLRALWHSFRARGLFRYRRRWLVLDLVRGLGLFALAALAIPLAGPLAFALFTIAILNVMWWVHDVCHDSVFADRARGRLAGELASMVFVGTPVLDYQYVVHRLHHGFTNVIGADQALDTGPVIWDERMRGRTTGGVVAVQAWLWFLVVLPLTFPLFLTMALAGRIKARDHGKLALVALRWAVACALFREHLVLLVGPVLCAAYLLAFFSSLNHFHKPMSDGLDPSFPRSVVLATQNLRDTGRLATWLTGGLNLHIEHHLFSTMPRPSLRLIAPEIRAYCAAHGLPYSTCSLAGSVAALWRKLRQPLAAVPAEEPVAP
jgi:fatty acid desaturase